MLTWSQLNQRHERCDDIQTKKLKLLYEGGYAIVKEARLFIKKLESETPAGYKDRLSHAAYENNFAEIINDYGANLMKKPVQVVEATDSDDTTTPGTVASTPARSVYMKFEKRANLRGDSFAQVLQHFQQQSNVFQRAYMGIDFDTLVDQSGKPVKALNLAEEERLGTNQPYLYDIDPLSVMDWDQDERGNFNFIILRKDERPRRTLASLRKTITTTFKVWQRDDQGVQWDLYRIEYDPQREPPADAEVPHVGSGTVDFKEIPIVCFEMPTNLYIGGLIGQLQESIYRRQASYLHALHRAMNGILVYQQGTEKDPEGDISSIEEDETRGASTLKNRARGMAVTGPNDKIYWAEPKGDALRIQQEQLKLDKNELYRLVNQMASMTGKGGDVGSTTKTSGVSKIMDNASKENVLCSYALVTKAMALKIFRIISQAIESSETPFQITGMDDYSVQDPDQITNRINLLPAIRQNIPSRTAYKQTLLDLVADLHPYMEHSTMTVVQDEIEQAVDQMNLDELYKQQAEPEPKEAPKSKPPSSKGN